METRNSPVDEYEAKQMQGTGQVLHRDKIVAKNAVLFMAPMALLALLGTIGVAMGADPSAPRALAVLPFLWFAWTVWMMLTKVSVRTVLTTKEVQVQWGLWGPTIPLGSITRCEAVPIVTTGLSAAQFGANVWAPNGSVLIHWKDEKAKERKVQFPAQNPGILAQQIEQALVRTSSGVRVESQSTPHELSQDSGDQAQTMKKSLK